jgi:hypothetical protein
MRTSTVQRIWPIPDRVTIDEQVVSGEVVFRSLKRPTLTIETAALPPAGIGPDGYLCVVDVGVSRYRFYATYKGAWQSPGKVTLTALEDVRPEAVG